MPNINISYKNLIPLTSLLPEILMYDEIIIYGAGETGYNIGLIMISYLKRNNAGYDTIRKIKYYDVTAKQGQYLHDIPVLKPDFNKCYSNSVLIIALDIGDIDKQVIKISSLGFAKIIDGYKMSKCFYNPLFFRIKDCGFETSEESFEEICARLDREAVPDTILHCIRNKLIEKPNDFDLLMKLGSAYESHNDVLSANDAYIMALKNAEDHVQYMQAKEKIDNLRLIIEKTEFTDWDYASSLNKAIALNYVGRSGSYYFTTLLENHPQMIVMPFNLIYNPDPKILALFYSSSDGVYVEELLKALAVENTYKNDNHMLIFTIGDDNEVYPADYNEKYLSVLKALILTEARKNKGIATEKFLYKARYFSHLKALGKKVDFSEGIPYIVHQILSIDTLILKHFIFHFPYAIQLATLRNPIMSFGSLLAGMQRMNKLNTAVFFRIFEYSLHNPVISDEFLANHTILIRIEDLNLFLRETMEALIKCLNIDWNNSLLKNTVNGKIFYDNYDFDNKEKRETGPRTSGITKSYERYFNSFDLFRLEALFYTVLKAWGYNTHNYINYKILEDLSKQPFKFEDVFEFQSENERLRFRAAVSSKYNDLLKKVQEPEYSEYLYKVRLIKPIIYKER